MVSEVDRRILDSASDGSVASVFSGDAMAAAAGTYIPSSRDERKSAANSFVSSMASCNSPHAEMSASAEHSDESSLSPVDYLAGMGSEASNLVGQLIDSVDKGLEDVSL